jgi:hypothetical protein
LPTPDPPTIATRSLASTVRSTRSRAVVLPKRTPMPVSRTTSVS